MESNPLKIVRASCEAYDVKPDHALGLLVGVLLEDRALAAVTQNATKLTPAPGVEEQGAFARAVFDHLRQRIELYALNCNLNIADFSQRIEAATDAETKAKLQANKTNIEGQRRVSLSLLAMLKNASEAGDHLGRGPAISLDELPGSEAGGTE